MNRFLQRFTVKDLVLIAALAALGIAIKPVLSPVIHLISAPLMIPGGAVGGGIYMMWMTLAFGMTNKRGTATLLGFIQALIVILAGATSSHGILSLVSYTCPGLAIDLGLLLIRHKVDGPGCAFLAGLLANVTGVTIVNSIFYGLPALPLMLSICVAMLSGGLGGLLTWQLLKVLRKFEIGVRHEEKK